MLLHFVLASWFSSEQKKFVYQYSLCLSVICTVFVKNFCHDFTLQPLGCCWQLNLVLDKRAGFFVFSV